MTARIAPDGEFVLEGEMFLGTIGEPRAPGPLFTGDIGRIDDQGRLWVEGRKSALIVTSFGRNISPEWVEAELTRSEEHTSELQSLMRDSYAVFCLEKKK